MKRIKYTINEDKISKECNIFDDSTLDNDYWNEVFNSDNLEVS